MRLEEIASDTDAPRYEIGVVFNFDWEHEEQDFLTCFERWSVSGPSLGSGESEEGPAPRVVTSRG